MVIRPGHRRYSVDLPEGQMTEHHSAKAEDGIAVAPRLRLLWELWRGDEELQARVRDLARERRSRGESL